MVLPRTVELQEWRHLRKARTGQIEQRASSLWARETTQIDGVREYIHGDRMSRIHWNATARTGGVEVEGIRTRGAAPLRHRP
ncbi:DUF58 domain-containing protein [Cohnella rhizosphaerae]|uniref:DUF58 domain-containing protein n=1 Tax=Cohnella rhizosphaerae TaxID=1457232 RepID=A0A9X4KWY7_9BACL|nr:DUF58 domain-containing protein [Cohnella rhizosphaerae]MDG0812063.1 DUF58 domain-containing protein [Cohnella rhizosphaerae]